MSAVSDACVARSGGHSYRCGRRAAARVRTRARGRPQTADEGAECGTAGCADGRRSPDRSGCSTAPGPLSPRSVTWTVLLQYSLFPKWSLARGVAVLRQAAHFDANIILCIIVHCPHSPYTATTRSTLAAPCWSTDWGTAWPGPAATSPDTPSRSCSCGRPATTRDVSSAGVTAARRSGRRSNTHHESVGDLSTDHPEGQDVECRMVLVDARLALLEDDERRQHHQRERDHRRQYAGTLRHTTCTTAPGLQRTHYSLL